VLAVRYVVTAFVVVEFPMITLVKLASVEASVAKKPFEACGVSDERIGCVEVTG
jgi:hypothetical protein